MGRLETRVAQNPPHSSADKIMQNTHHKRSAYILCSVSVFLRINRNTVSSSFIVIVPRSCNTIEQIRQVLSKHLLRGPQNRLRFWEISGCGTQGNCRNLWLNLQRSSKKKRSSPAHQ